MGGPFTFDFKCPCCDATCEFHEERVPQVTLKQVEIALPRTKSQTKNMFVETNKPPGYHNTRIPKGFLGEPSKIFEECYELEDAMDQEAKVMAICEMADIVGALDAFREKHFPHIKMDDLIKMAELTKRAFQNGHRK